MKPNFDKEAVDLIKTENGFEIVYIKYDLENGLATIDRQEVVADNKVVGLFKMSEYFAYKINNLVDRLKKKGDK